MSFTEFYKIVEKFIDLLKMPGYIDDEDSDYESDITEDS